jgi:hypothetical protein
MPERGLARSLGTVVTVATLWSMPVHAADRPRRTALSWVRDQRAESCISPEALERDVERRLGRDPFQEPADHRIEGIVRREEQRWVVRLYEHDAQGHRLGMRTIESHSTECRELDSAVALAVALIIDPDIGRGSASAAFPEPSAPASPGDATRAGPTGDERASLPAPVAPVGPAMPLATYQPTRPEPTPVALMVGASLAQDLLPGLAPVFSIATDVGFGSAIHGRLGALYAPERRRRETTMDFALGLTAASLGICYETRAALGPVVCASLLGGALHAVVYSPEPTRPGDRAWGAARIDAGLGVRAGRLVAELRGWALAPLVRWQFRVQGREVAFREPSVVPGLELALGWRFP